MKSLKSLHAWDLPFLKGQKLKMTGKFQCTKPPDEHPARDMQDTFFIQRDPDYLLRTQPLLFSAIYGKESSSYQNNLSGESL